MDDEKKGTPGPENPEKKNPGNNNPGKGKKPRKKKPWEKKKPKKEENDNGDKGKPCPKQDPFWYAVDEAAIKNMASFPFLEVVGDNIANVDYVPGMVVAGFVPTVGSAAMTDTTSTTNYRTRAAQAYYQYVTQGFTGGVDFEAPDLLMTALAAENVFACICEGKRVYGLLRYYTQFNKYYAEGMVRSLGFDYDNLVFNLADFRAELNIRIDQVNKILAVPKGFFIGDRWEFITSNVFTDTDDPEYSTAYAWVAEKFMYYNPTLLKTGTCLGYINKFSNSDGFQTVDNYFSTLDYLINALIDDDVRAMFGAIRRVYDSSQLKTVSTLDENFVLSLSRSDIVAMQFHNMWWDGLEGSSVQGYAPAAVSTGSSSVPGVAVYQDAQGNVLSHIYLDYPSSAGIPYYFSGDTEMILDLYDHLVSPANVLDATANMQMVRVSSDPTGGLPIYCRCEAIAHVYYVSNNFDSKAKLYARKFIDKTSSVADWTVDYKLTHMDSHPLLCMVTVTEKSLKIESYLGEIDKYTQLSFSDIKKLHDRTLYQLLAMPANSKSVTK